MRYSKKEYKKALLRLTRAVRSVRNSKHLEKGTGFKLRGTKAYSKMVLAWEDARDMLGKAVYK